jgi:hypothetical protein
VEVYLELGTKRVFAAAVEWPGWCRGGRDEAAAIEALLAYRERYAEAVGAAGGKLPTPATAKGLRIIERLSGGAGTDFGVPGNVPRLDEAATSDKELERLVELHAACWRTLKRVAARAKGHQLEPAGPRGGGRSVAKIDEHVAGAEAAYIASIGVRYGGAADDDTALRREFVAALRERAAGNLPERGPRGGRRWPARYAVRRSCWHLLDHAWEIEDRLR